MEPHSAMTLRETLFTTLRERGYRITPQRELIINAISPTSSHFTAEMVFKEVHRQAKAINLATIYRTLDLLVEEGLVSRSDFGQGQIIYATEEHGPHIHLVCRQCGQVTDAEAAHADSLRASLWKDHHFQLDRNHLTLFGVCSQCQQGEASHESA